MRHKGVIIGVSLGFGVATFLILYLVSVLVPAVSLLIAILCGVAVFSYSITITFITYARSTRVLTRLCAELRDERILYCDIASLMDNHRERTGALVVTGRRVVFETSPRMRKGATRLDFDLTKIFLVENVREHFQMAAGGRRFRFKVYRCDVLVDTVRQAIDERVEALRILGGQQPGRRKTDRLSPPRAGRPAAPQHPLPRGAAQPEYQPPPVPPGTALADAPAGENWMAITLPEEHTGS